MCLIIQALTDLHDWGIAVTYHMKGITPDMGISALYVMVETLLVPNSFPTAIRLADQFVRSFAYLLVREFENRFSLELKDFDRYFSRAEGKHGMEYMRSILQGLYFKLKTEPKLDNDMLKFVDI